MAEPRISFWLVWLKSLVCFFRTQCNMRTQRWKAATSPGHRQVGRRPMPQDTACVSDVPSLSAQVLPGPTLKESLLPFFCCCCSNCFSIPPSKRTWDVCGLVCAWLIHWTWAGCDRVTWKLVSGMGSQKELWPKLNQKASSLAFSVKCYSQRLAYKRSSINAHRYSHGCSLKLERNKRWPFLSFFIKTSKH